MSIFSNFLQYLGARLVERSTWTGLITAGATIAGAAIDPTQIGVIATTGALVASGALALFKEQPAGTTPVPSGVVPILTAAASHPAVAQLVAQAAINAAGAAAPSVVGAAAAINTALAQGNTAAEALVRSAQTNLDRAKASGDARAIELAQARVDAVNAAQAAQGIVQ